MVFDPSETEIGNTIFMRYYYIDTVYVELYE